MSYPRVSTFKTPEQFRQRLADLEIELPLVDEVQHGSNSPLAQPLVSAAGLIGNRFCILPMEGWDGTTDGRPSELTRRRWLNFGRSGAKLLWGSEAAAVRHDGRANPNQLVMVDSNASEIADMRQAMVDVHQQEFGRTDDLSVGLQLTHSGRYCKPNEKTTAEPMVAYRHPVLDARMQITDEHVLSDDDLKRLIDDFLKASVLAKTAGFDWVDVKHCHGYLGHELLSGYDRTGEFGGSFENRTRFLREIVAGIRAEAPGLGIGVRLSLFDFMPFVRSEEGVGQPIDADGYSLAFGGDDTGLGIDLTEPSRFVELLEDLEIDLLCTTAGSPYYNPHIQRPAIFPPSDGYHPPEDPLVGVARQIKASAELKQKHPGMIIVGSGYSYLQEWLPNVGEGAVAANMVDSVGLGRMVLSYPELPADVLAGRSMPRKKICRTFSDCTSGPRQGLISGCFPLDPFYKDHPERAELKRLKAGEAS